MSLISLVSLMSLMSLMGLMGLMSLMGLMGLISANAVSKGDHLHICTFSHLHINQAFAHSHICTLITFPEGASTILHL